MSLILGIEYCRIDANGRFKFPIALKKQMEAEENRFFIRKSNFAECLELWPYASFQAEMEKLNQELISYNPEDRALLRELTRGNIIELDTNDRLSVPQEQKSRIKTAKDIVLQATGHYIEIWDSETYHQKFDQDADVVDIISSRLGKRPTENEG